MMRLVKKWFYNEKFLFVLMLLMVLVPTVQRLLQTANSEDPYTSYNNYIIFKNAFFHLFEGVNLYDWYLDKQWDLFKYSPTFALLMGFFAVFPDWIGLFLWNFANTFVVYLALKKFPFPKFKYQYWAIVLCLAEAITNTHNAQSNGLMAGLLLLGFLLFEQRKIALATLLIVLTFYIKIYGLAFLVLLLFYPNKLKTITWSMVWIVVLGLIPAFVLGVGGLKEQYLFWWDLLKTDQGESFGLSIMGIAHVWFGISDIKNWVMLFGVFAFFIPLVQFKKFVEFKHRALYVAHILLWLIVFNHKSESPTFIIAITGVVVWYFVSIQDIKSRIGYTSLLLFSLFFCVLAPTDFYPPFIRESFFEPYAIKVVPCIVIWIKVFVDLMTSTKKVELTSGSST